MFKQSVYKLKLLGIGFVYFKNKTLFTNVSSQIKMEISRSNVIIIYYICILVNIMTSILNQMSDAILI